MHRLARRNVKRVDKVEPGLGYRRKLPGRREVILIRANTAGQARPGGWDKRVDKVEPTPSAADTLDNMSIYHQDRTRCL